METGLFSRYFIVKLTPFNCIDDLSPLLFCIWTASFASWMLPDAAGVKSGLVPSLTPINSKFWLHFVWLLDCKNGLQYSLQILKTLNSPLFDSAPIHLPPPHTHIYPHQMLITILSPANLLFLPLLKMTMQNSAP